MFHHYFIPEIIKEVENGGDNLNELLRNSPELESDCLPRALLAAVRRDDHISIGKLVTKGAQNLSEGLELAEKEGKHCALAILLLVTAAMRDDHSLVLRLFSQSSGADDIPGKVRVAVISRKVSTVVPIEIAQRKKHRATREELLLRTDVNQAEGFVDWHGLHPNELEVTWLRKISWVKQLHLARNGFRFLPVEIGSCLPHVNVEFGICNNNSNKILYR